MSCNQELGWGSIRVVRVGRRVLGGYKALYRMTYTVVHKYSEQMRMSEWMSQRWMFREIETKKGLAADGMFEDLKKVKQAGGRGRTGQDKAFSLSSPKLMNAWLGTPRGHRLQEMVLLRSPGFSKEGCRTNLEMEQIKEIYTTLLVHL